MEQLVLTPLDSYEIVRDRALAAARPLLPAAALVAAWGLAVVLTTSGSAAMTCAWALLVLNMVSSACLGLALGMWASFRFRATVAALGLAIACLCLLETGSLCCFWESGPVAVILPFGRVMLAGLVFASCESLFNRQRLPGEADEDPSEPSDDSGEAEAAQP